jgi:hypothetical protein
MGQRKRRRSDRAGRPPMRSPGRPPVARRSITSGSGRRSPTGYRVSTPAWLPACRRRWASGGFVRVAACQRSVARRRRGAICRSPSVRRRHPAGQGLQRARDRSPPRPIAVDDLARAGAQRRDAERRVGVSRDDGAVARRPAGSAPEAGQARVQPDVAAVRAGPARRGDRGLGRPAGGRSAGPLDRPSSSAPAGAPLGQVVESGADRQPTAGGVPG